MGYTHYWTLERTITQPEMTRIATDINAIVLASEIPLAYEYDEPTRPPHIDGDYIRFNGVGNDGHETFMLESIHIGFNFCKTASKPYDVVVTASLIVLKDALGPDVEISSDGDAEDWIDGLNLAERATGRSLVNPINDDYEGEPE